MKTSATFTSRKSLSILLSLWALCPPMFAQSPQPSGQMAPLENSRVTRFRKAIEVMGVDAEVEVSWGKAEKARGRIREIANANFTLEPSKAKSEVIDYARMSTLRLLKPKITKYKATNETDAALVQHVVFCLGIGRNVTVKVRNKSEIFSGYIIESIDKDHFELHRLRSPLIRIAYSEVVEIKPW
jgi:hypothetical protein